MSEVVEDRISNLPASLLHHILSFVDTREAAQTSVLSKRWKYIWRSIPILEFRCRNPSQVGKFMDFVDRTLEFHDESNIHKFSLFPKVLLSEPRFEKWIATVVSHNVEDLELHLCPVLMPPSLYTCESLIHLRLLNSPITCIPEYISFPRLERFMLFDVGFIDEFWNDQLFSNCPVLLFLVVGYCTWYDTKNVCISNLALKDLTISNPEEQDGFRNCSLQIHAPSLEGLTCRGRVAKDYTLSSFPALFAAHIDLFFEEYGATWEQARNYGVAVNKFLRALEHVEYLTISNRTLQVLSVADDLVNSLPSYHNLSELCLTQKLTAFKALIALLEKAPNLVSLEFKKFVPSFPGEKDHDDDDAGDDGGEDIHYNDAAEEEDYSDNEDDDWALDMASTRCSFLHLKLVSFNEFSGSTREMRLLKLILKNAKALETMSISYDPISSMKNENAVTDISSFPRASASCVFKFLSKQG